MEAHKFDHVKNIIFDMDGTLVNTALATVPACQQIAEIFNLPQKEPADITRLIGYADMEFYDHLYPGYDKHILNKYAAAVEKRENELTKELGANILFTGIAELLNALSQKGFCLSVASTGSISHVETALGSSGISSFFKDIRCGEPEKTGMVKEIIKNGREGEWLILGDKSSDYTAGKNNKIITVAAKYGFGAKIEYEQFDCGIDYPLQLLLLLIANENT